MPTRKKNRRTGKKTRKNEERIESINSATSVRDESRVCNSKKMNYYGGLLLLLAN